MDLLNNENISNVYNKNNKKSIRYKNRFDIFLVICILVLIVSPLLFNVFVKMPAAVISVGYPEIFISPRFSEFFGSDFADNLINEFKKLNPDIRVDTAGFVNDQYKAPDILFFDEGDSGELLSSGALMNLESYNSNYQYLVPLVTFMDMLYYNTALLSAAGFDRPPKTREEFLLFARTVSNGNNEVLEGAAGTAISLREDDKQAVSRDIFSWIWASGNNFLQDDSSPVFNTRAIIRDISFLGSLYREGALKKESLNLTGERLLYDFADGKIALLIASSGAIPALREKMGDETFGITTIPGSGLGGKYSFGISGIYAAISADCENSEAANVFMEFLIGNIPLMCSSLKAVPGDITNIFTGDYMQDDPFYSKARDIFESAQIVRSFTAIPNGEEYKKAVREEMQFFFETNRTPEQTAAAIQRRWEEINP